MPGQVLGQSRGDGAVVVDESPTAGLLISQLLDQVADNPQQSARTSAEVLAEYGDRLVPAESDDPDLFVTARVRVEEILLDHPVVGDRFVEFQEPVARDLVERGLFSPRSILHG